MNARPLENWRESRGPTSSVTSTASATRPRIVQKTSADARKPPRRALLELFMLTKLSHNGIITCTPESMNDCLFLIIECVTLHLLIT